MTLDPTIELEKLKIKIDKIQDMRLIPLVNNDLEYVNNQLDSYLRTSVEDTVCTRTNIEEMYAHFRPYMWMYAFLRVTLDRDQNLYLDLD